MRTLQRLDGLLCASLAIGRTIVTLLVLAGSVVASPPATRRRSAYAIVRTVDRQMTGEFDPREIVGEMVILTLPFDVEHQRTRPIGAGFLEN